MGRYKNLKGQIFHQVEVLEDAGRTPSQKVLWLCKCYCGKEFITIGSSLISGNTKSCGCYHVANHKIHGDSIIKAPIYSCWHAIKQRCFNPKNKEWHNYGGRGITMCDRWKDYLLFKQDMLSGYVPGLSIDRINNDGNYEPDNCKWSTPKQQSRNKRNLVFYETPFGKITLPEISELTGVHKNTLGFRILHNKNISYEELTKPAKKYNYNR